MVPNNRWSRLCAGAVAGLSLLLLTACAPEGSDETAPGPNLSGILTDETLAGLADDAWRAAGFTGTPAPVDTANGRTVGSGSVSVVDTGLDTAAVAAGLPDAVDYGAAGGLTLPNGGPAIAQGISHSLESVLTPLTSAELDVNGTYACPNGGTVTGYGTISLNVQQTLTGVAPNEKVVDGSLRTQLDDVVFRLNGCGTATHRMWGTVLIAVDNLLTATQDAVDPLIHTIEMLVNERVQAGLAYEDLGSTGTYYRVSLRYTRFGSIDATKNELWTPGEPNYLVLIGSLAASMESNGIVCQTTVTFDGGTNDGGMVDKPACSQP